MLIGLIRHGVTDWNIQGKIQGQTDIPLNEEGRRQAALLAERLIKEPYTWHYVITSKLSRAHETGAIIAERLGIPLLEPDLRLNERNFGQAEGLTVSEREAKWGKEWNKFELGQEQEAEVQKRALEFMEDMWNRYPDRNLLVVSHGGFLSQLYSAVYKDQHTERIGNLSLSIVEKKDLDWVPLLYNCTQHLLETDK
ncbi:histidine phosphatase family protein [Paenibacillus sediminis]|uniref:Broad specificity phosphatase PhoE n=1 Tax=Paenibacillus sediminis TaxID=664909 RepID=A0ABS4GZS2_9BACL|nr:histidine phosphatase family protein [Paenibacillus sediminis]MBP1935778.1 broad specificity phosphatase PhoE [Paenibacillus sediminis]